MNDTFKIISLEVTDFKRITAASIMIGDGLTKITGANGAGKSSVIDAIFYALKPDGVEMPINENANRAKIVLRIGNEDHGYTIDRSITESGKYLTITNDAGKKIASPQSFLNSLYAAMADPNEFMMMKQKDQCEALRIACKCDTRELDAQYKEKYDERTIVNRRLDQAEKALLELGDEPDKLTPKSASELTNKSDELRALIASVEEKFDKGKSINENIDRKESEIKSVMDQNDDYLNQIEVIKAKIKANDERMKDMREELIQLNKGREALREDCTSQLPAYKAAKAEIESIKQEVASIDEHNRKATEHALWMQKKSTLSEDRDKFHGESYALTEQLKEIEKEKKELLELADYPVEGMLIEGDKIYVGNVPFSNLNTAEQIKISTFVSIAQNPKLKMIIIRNGSMLDENSLSIIKKIADDKDYQILMEKVSTIGDLDSIHIVEGKIESDHGVKLK